MLRTLRLYLLVLCGTALFAGCCANSVCDCQDERADALYFRFPIDDSGANPRAFLSSEVDTLWLLRFNRDTDTTSLPRRDSVNIRRPLAQAADPLVLNNNAPFAAVGARKLNAFEYHIRLLDRSGQLRSFVVRNIQLQGDFEGDGCCTCYTNSFKAAEVNGQAYTLTETNRQPVVITLAR